MEELGATIYLTNDIAEYTNKDLETIADMVKNELKKRYETARRKAWDEMTIAIRNYTKEYGEIYFMNDSEEDTVNIGCTFTADFKEEIIYGA